tara:strand:- start:600 stop:1598 length:999 start_codon:yes stop_codon:yes gene_type:complete
MSNFLVTGGCGFIGSYVIDELIAVSKNLEDQDAVKIYNVDKMGIGSSRENIKTMPDAPCYNIFLDICSNYLEDQLPAKIDYVIHLAAESHVDRSIDNPLAFVDSNIKGTAKILELVRKHDARMVHVSTDEVYGHLAKEDPPFTEDSPLKPRSPYSASKASSDLLVQSYINTYGIRATITRCCNNYGPRQHSEKLIPTVLNSIFSGKMIPVYGTGENIREWIHAEDHAKAILEILFDSSATGQVRNLCGSNVLSNVRLVTQIITEVEAIYPEYKREKQGAMLEYIEFVKDRKGHDFKYELSTIHTKELDSIIGQRPFDLSDTIQYYGSKFTAY